MPGKDLWTQSVPSVFLCKILMSQLKWQDICVANAYHATTIIFMGRSQRQGKKRPALEERKNLEKEKKVLKKVTKEKGEEKQCFVLSKCQWLKHWGRLLPLDVQASPGAHAAQSKISQSHMFPVRPLEGRKWKKKKKKRPSPSTFSRFGK